MIMNKKVALAMSGGVDSSVAAILLQAAGYEVIGITLRLWGSAPAEQDAKKVADILKIPHYVMDMTEEFEQIVIGNFVQEYASGHTPNPCIVCNKNIKFGKLFAYAEELGADYLATGHYANKVLAADGKYYLQVASDEKKDQSYVLYTLSQKVLQKVLFPLANYNKTTIREIANKNNLPVFNKPDSQEICFIPDNNYRAFLKQHSPETKIKKGHFVNRAGKILGVHQGIMNYTVGQRKGLGIAYGRPLYVLEINTARNEIVLGDREELTRTNFLVKDVVFTNEEILTAPKNVLVKIRYGNNWRAGTIIPAGEFVEVCFDNTAQAVTPGQSAVFYQDKKVIGGGIII